MMRVLVLLAAVTSLVLSEGSCPAFSNTVEPEPNWEDMIDREECYDQDKGCGSCSDLCSSPDYTHWMEKNCPLTCGKCKAGTHEAMVSAGAAACWTSGKGYPDEDIYKTYELQTMKDCTEKCVADEDCGGVHIEGSTTKCMLAKHDSVAYSRWGYYVAVRYCLAKEYKDCDDYWRGCEVNGASICDSDCPWIRQEYKLICQLTCDTCDYIRPTPLYEPTVAPTPAPAGVTWEIIEGKKGKGTAIETGASLTVAKMICEAMGSALCEGLSCKGYDDCSVMRAGFKKKTKTGFTVYKMIVPAVQYG